MSIGDESIPRAVQAEISHMTLEEAIALGLFDLPNEPGMVRIPITRSTWILWRLLYPPEPSAMQHAPDELFYDMAHADAKVRRRRLTGVAAVTNSFRTMISPVAEKAEFRDMLQATRRGRSQIVPPLPASDAEGNAAIRDLLVVIRGSRGQSLPASPAAEPIAVTDAEFGYFVDIAPSGNAKSGLRAAATVAQHDTVEPTPGGSGGGAGGRDQVLPTLPVAELIDTTNVELPRIVVDDAPSGNAHGKPPATAAVTHYNVVAQDSLVAALALDREM